MLLCTRCVPRINTWNSIGFVAKPTFFKPVLFKIFKTGFWKMATKGLFFSESLGLGFSDPLVIQVGSLFLHFATWQPKTEHTSAIVLKIMKLIWQNTYVVTPGSSSDTPCLTVAPPCKLKGLIYLGVLSVSMFLRLSKVHIRSSKAEMCSWYVLLYIKKHHMDIKKT